MLLGTVLSVYNVLSFSSVSSSNVSKFSVFWSQYWNFLEKSLIDQLFHYRYFWTDTDPDGPDNDRHALDADPDPDPAKGSESDPTRIHNSDNHSAAPQPIHVPTKQLIWTRPWMRSSKATMWGEALLSAVSMHFCTTWFPFASRGKTIHKNSPADQFRIRDVL